MKREMEKPIREIVDHQPREHNEFYNNHMSMTMQYPYQLQAEGGGTRDSMDGSHSRSPSGTHS